MGNQLAHGLDRSRLAVVIARGGKGRADIGRRLGKVDKGANGREDLGGVEVVDVELVRERIRLQLANVVLVAVGDVVQHGLDLVVAKVVGVRADLVDARLVARRGQVEAVAGAVHGVEGLQLRGLVVGRVVVRVAREDGEVVVGGVLQQRVVPAVADEDALEADGVGAGQRAVLDGGVLGLEVGVEDGAVVAAVALGGEVEALARVLREGAREALQRLPEARGRGLGRVGGGQQVGVRVGAARQVGGVVRAGGVGQLDDIVVVGQVARDGGRVAEAGASGLVDEEQVAGVVPGVGVVVSGFANEDLLSSSHHRDAGRDGNSITYRSPL